MQVGDSIKRLMGFFGLLCFLFVVLVRVYLVLEFLWAGWYGVSVMDKLKLAYKLSPIFLVVVTLFAFYFAYNCWKDEKAAKAEAERINTVFTQYKEDNKAIKQIEKNITEAITNANNATNELRNNVDNGLVELLVKVESIERDTTTASTTANKALRLARTTQQDYYNLTNAISYNKAMIEGWQKYYCTVIAPKNGSESMCSEVIYQKDDW